MGPCGDAARRPGGQVGAANVSLARAGLGVPCRLRWRGRSSAPDLALTPPQERGGTASLPPQVRVLDLMPLRLTVPRKGKQRGGSGGSAGVRGGGHATSPYGWTRLTQPQPCLPDTA